MLFIHTSLWLQSSFISSLGKQQGLYRYFTAASLTLLLWEGGGACWGIAFIPGRRGGCHRDATWPDVRSLGLSSSACDHPVCTSSLTDSGSGYEAKRTTHPRIRKHFQLGWLVFSITNKEIVFVFLPPEVLTGSLWLQYWDILSFETIVYDFLDL